MSGLSFATVYGNDFTSMTEASRQLRKSGDDFDSAADQVRAHGRTVPKMWEGVDADAATRVLTDQAQPLEDTGQALRKASRVIADLGTQLNGHHEQLKDLVTNALHVPADVDTGSGHVTPKPIVGATFNSAADVRAFNLEKKKREYWADWYDAEIKRTVRKAQDADDAAAGVLADIDQYKESRNAYSGRFGQDADVEDADRAAGLLTRTVLNKLNATEVAELKRLLAQNMTDAQFARRFLASPTFGKDEKEAAKGLLLTYGHLAAEGSNDATVQRSLGNIIATGIDQNNPEAVSNSWTTGFTEALNEDFKLPVADRDWSYKGSQIAVPLVEFGDFSDENGSAFLNSVADNVYRQSREAETLQYARFGLAEYPNFNPSNPGYGHPLNSVLVGLRNNPEAAKRFFGQSEDHRRKVAHVLSSAGPSQGALDAAGAKAGFNVKDFLSYGRLDADVVGDALEAAATRKDFDAFTQLDQSVNDAFNAEVFAGIVDHISHNKGYAAFRAPDGRLGALADNIGRISAYYIDDIHKARTDNPNLNFAWSQNDKGAPVIFEPGTLRGFLSSVGQHPDSYYGIRAASQAYTKLAVQQRHGDSGLTNLVLGSHVNIVNDLADGALKSKQANAWDFASKDRVNSIVDGVKPVVDFVIDKFVISKITKPGSRLDGYGPELGAIEGQITDGIAKYIKDEAGVDADAKTRTDQRAWQAIEFRNTRDFLHSTATAAFEHYVNSQGLTRDEYVALTGDVYAKQYQERVAETYDPNLDLEFKPR